MILDSILNIFMLVIVPMTFAIGIYFSIRLKWVQITKFNTAIKLVSRPSSQKKGTLSSFAAFASVLGGNLGVGNIAGVAVALKTGGPGSIFWMWVMAILASSLKFVSCCLGGQYKQSIGNGRYVGGPMYYIRDGLQLPFLAKVFCVITIFASLTVGNLAQVNSIALTLDGLNPMIILAAIVVILLFIFAGNIQRFAQASILIVPAMAICYILACVFVLINFSSDILAAGETILFHAFTPKAILGGGITYTVLQAIQVGFNRGLFATDAGAGLESILHASVSDSNVENREKLAYQQALISTVAPLFVVFLCTMTALVLMVTGVWEDQKLVSSAMCVEAFKIGLNWEHANFFLSGIVFFFGITTVITWSFCSDRALEFLFKKNTILGKLICIGVVPLGIFTPVDTVWKLGDIAFNLMLFINVISIFILFRKVFPAANHWLKSKEAMFS